VRDIYINAIGATAEQGAPFPDGTVMVMDLMDVQKDDDGTALTDKDGNLIKTSLLKTYVMEKNAGWGAYVPADERNGDWLYAAYAKDGVTELTDPTTPCLTCHLPLGKGVDWVHRYEEYFQRRSAAAPAAPAPTTPTVPLPSGYQSWEPFLLNVQRPDSLQVRDIYINAIGAKAERGAPFPDGTVMVMDLMNVQKDDDGKAVLDDDGNLIKTSRLKTYVMAKHGGWGSLVPAGQRNGDWLYGAYASDGVTELKDPTTTCFACHTPLGASVDWVHRYDEYFDKRDAAAD
ncbi:MAG: cytochrome P460 family protein, partial [Pseudomonadota bacterium]